MMAIHIPEEDRCYDILELIENEELIKLVQKGFLNVCPLYLIIH